MNVVKFHVIIDDFNLNRTSGGSASLVRNFSNQTDYLKNENV